MSKTNAKAPNWHEIRLKATKPRLYYLNDYRTPTERFRIESTRGGALCLWKAKTSLKKMEETKRFMEKCWGK